MSRRGRAPLRALILAASLLGGLAACGNSAELVELRLYPCAFGGMEPRSVTVEITGFDDQGELVEVFEERFDDIVGGAFDDGFATVGYRKHAEVRTATIRLGWFSAAEAGPIDQAEAIAVHEEVAVPALGEVLELDAGVDDCAELVAEGGTTTGDGDTGTTTGDGDTGTTTGDTDTDTTTTTTTTTTDTDTDTDTDTGTTTGGTELPMPGDDCNHEGLFACVPAPDDQTGTALLCVDGQLADSEDFAFACDDGGCPPDTAVAGCGGFGYPAACMCTPDSPESCDNVTLGCDVDILRLCFEGQVVVGTCLSCSETPEGYYQCQR